jgi:hypothetical protein
MGGQDPVRELYARVAATQDLDALDEILIELRALMRDHFAYLRSLYCEHNAVA